MNEIKETKKNQLQVDFEETIAEKNKTIHVIEQERDSAISAQMKYEKDIDNLKAEKKAALDRAERAEARYLRNVELETKGKQQEKDLLNKLFS
jgi:CO/xanthine dehydrogenase Mo-binding subunit